MKKKLLLFIFLFLGFIYMRPVSALDVSVCDFECDYSSIDEALAAVEDYSVYGDSSITWSDGADTNQLEPVNIFVSTWNEQHLSNHTLKAYVNISFSYSAGVIDGAGATITTNKGIILDGRNVDFKNVNIVYNGEYARWSDSTDVPDAVLELSGGNVRVLDVSIKATKTGRCDDFPDGLDSYATNFSLENVTIENFGYGVYAQNSLNANHCILDKNVVSVYNYGTGVLSNSKVGSIITGGEFAIEDNNDLGDMKVRFVNDDDVDSISDEEYCNMLNTKSIFVGSDNPYVSVSMKKSIEVSLNDKQSIDNMLNMFKENSINSNSFIFTSSDEGIATIKNNVINLLVPGDVSIAAVNEDTRETYTLNIKVTKPLVNPLTSRNSIYFFIGLIAVSLGGLSIYKLKKEH